MLGAAPMEWTAFSSGLLGSAVPGSILSLLMLYLTHRNNRAIERHKKEIQQDIVKFTKWHEQRLSALLVIYSAFCDHLDFLRKVLYPCRQVGICMDPIHAFDQAIKRQTVYLDNKLTEKVGTYQGELLQFWNWAMSSRGDDVFELRRRLDYEIPEYLKRLREDINEFLDPNYRDNGKQVCA
jgi:hypothetical protein